MNEPQGVPLPGRGILRLSGEDARSFLQGLVSNDVEALAVDRALYAALLTPQGKYLFDFLLYQQGDGAILLDAERERLPALRQRLLLYRLRAKVTIEDWSDRLMVLAVIGDEAAPRLDLPPRAGAARGEGDVLLAVDPRTSALGVRVVLPADAIDGFCRRHALARGDFADWDRLRLAQAVPDGSRDLAVERSLLLESGFEELNGVSFTKGCYVGQELTARTKHRALVKKRLMPVRVAGPLPPPGTPVLLHGRDAGEVRSGQGDLALALLRLEPLAQVRADPEAVLTAGDARLNPIPPAWLAARLPNP